MAAAPRRWDDRRRRLLNRLAARRAGHARITAAIGATPEPLGAGRFAQGRQIVAGRILLGGQSHQAPGVPIWDLPADALAEADRQGCGWLDDLAAVGDGPARAIAQAWVTGWIDRYGSGTGPGWEPDLTGQRLLRWIGNAAFLRRGLASEAEARLATSIARQALFLSRRWQGSAAGLPRIQALSGLILAGLALRDRAGLAAMGAAALAREASASVDDRGAIASRNPEDLSEILFLLTHVAAALDRGGIAVPPVLRPTIARIAPTLRALRHADGGLARFHGGGRGADGRLDAALAATGNRDRCSGLAMGFARLAAGRTTVLMDAAPPPTGAASARAHAATLAFELTSGRRPVIINCGAGDPFGPEWRRAGRATASQSALGIDAFSSSRLGEDDLLTEVPAHVPHELTSTVTSLRAGAAHDGWQRTHGLTHARTLDLTLDGRALTGEELLIALSDRDKAAFDAASGGMGVGWSVRFHLHPEAEPSLDMGGKAVSIALKSGEVWVFRQDGAAAMMLAPSVQLEQGRPAPRATQQVVLSGRAMDYATRVRWSLAKAQDTPNALRDLAPGADGEE